jgi:dolichol-phosphate mannosyltransferase
MSDRKLISVVVPAYNEGECVEELARRLQKVFDEEDAYDFEVIIVENGSTDDTYEKLLAIRAADDRFKVIQLSRNFYMEGGMDAGLAAATGDAAVIMSAYLQDPTEIIHDFIVRWEEGYENVYGVITERQGTGIVRRVLAVTFYWIINKLSDQSVPRNASDFRLVDRRVYETFNEMAERGRMVRAMFGWVGFRSIGVEHERPPRHGGKSTFQPIKTAGFAVRGILANSNLPLKVIPLFGLALSFLSFFAIVIITWQAIFYGVPFPGFGTLASLMFLTFGFLFCFLGIVSEYIGMIFHEVRGRPTYIVRERHGLDKPSS